MNIEKAKGRLCEIVESEFGSTVEEVVRVRGGAISKAFRLSANDGAIYFAKVPRAQQQRPISGSRLFLLS